MALNAMRCPECHLIFESRTVENIKCPNCKSSAVWVPSFNVSNFSPFYHPHLSHEPVYIDSARTLDRELESRGLRLADGSGKVRGKLPQSREEALNG